MASGVALVIVQTAAADCPATLMAAEPLALMASLEPPDSHVPACLLDRSTGCDWANEAISSLPLGDDRRLIVLRASHLAGSGAWDHLRLYGCDTGEVRRLLAKRYLYGVRLAHVDGQHLVLISGQSQSGDPICCPSAKVTQVFLWQPARNAYVEVEP
jgi:hypothetical protein